ncbi:type II toxin-antitoxin system RelB/DinJ family antitoxin [Lactiplantibacillus pentosus]|uniref:Type II toxin-antitoxin system RelB/DinJ family antitoxin n=1 Tax=Lactiplantibacillus pentosus TaxID=1589 RepID=A0AB37RFW5_LACPE|nr:type II toxin-antitoxin system RelB/DinJ family antitoxin [Lactiplantibacillus pentosus]RMW42261.1 type II toxin-antitoxin system RelB/DinJ family antitoxin [Lactiplantibacillus pentosus]RMW48569.1 type II toxin-antitoxin system RelB/DinJ family antitoxin [Lactiplantibacillus pentosus]RMW52706.1 type II toxin-antitoxin system RelB/DinJ family antitoxin [Lactiplantibacillus pentosus]RMW55440.1 type II toxin-antitoxin system RelB/DinJ family antitoxin [Lactiplantibacillus pentosus]
MARIEARIDEDVKSKAQDVLAKHGLTISDFVRMTLTTVANEGLPKYYSIPNRELKHSIQEVIDDLSDKEKLPEAHSFKELEKLLNSNKDESN